MIFLLIIAVLIWGAVIWEEFLERPEESLIPERFTIIVLPDTQKYAENYPEIFDKQTEWIINQKEKRNIVFVSHEGDIVENWDSEKEWKNIDFSLSKLDGRIAYGLLPGNHDMSQSRQTDYYNQYFSVSRFGNYDWWGGNYPSDSNNNNYQLFSIGKDDYIILHLEFCPTLDVIDWANQILKENSKRRAIITTHGYLNGEAKRNIHVSSKQKGGCGSSPDNTQYLWDKLIFLNPNVFLVLSGHVHSEARRTDKNIFKEPVYQLLADYQDRKNGGNGWLRIIEFVPEEDKIFVKTYSPYLNKFERDKDSNFLLNYDMAVPGLE